MHDKYPNVSVKLILRSKDGVLILHNSKDGSFDFPGGQMEWGESPQGALKRELIEELTYKLSEEPKFLDIWNYISKDGSRHSVFLYYFLAIEESPKLIPTDEEPDAEIVWMSKDKLKTIIQDPAFLEKIFS